MLLRAYGKRGWGLRGSPIFEDGSISARTQGLDVGCVMITPAHIVRLVIVHQCGSHRFARISEPHPIPANSIFLV